MYKIVCVFNQCVHNGHYVDSTYDSFTTTLSRHVIGDDDL